MQRTGFLVLSALMLAWLIWVSPGMAETAEASGEETEQAEWTVLFYFCGADLESQYGFATSNLMEIRQCSYPDSILPELAESRGEQVDMDKFITPGNVNILIETGGSAAWSIDPDIMDVDVEHLQYWRYDYSPPEDFDLPETRFLLEETLPLASMANSRTLSDFIQWGAQHYPADKYALVLWGHGGGSKTGLFLDELFGGDIMRLNMLRSALKTGGVHFEAVLIDACMMANMETAWAIHECAEWLIASEETVAGQGTAMYEWLQELIYNPSVDGQALGRNICDMTMMKYAKIDNEQARQLLTWSVIDLDKIHAVIRLFDRVFQVLDYSLEAYPTLIWLYETGIAMCEEYGNGREGMRDLAYLFYADDAFPFLDYKLRSDMQKALSEAVVYAVRGSGRNAARGLSFCYATDFDAEELSLYAANCPSPSYLAFLDAICDWDAPGWVYEVVPRLPQIETLEAYRIVVDKRMGEDGIPQIVIDMDHIDNTSEILYNLYQEDEATGQLLNLGRTVCIQKGNSDDLDLVYAANDPMHWPTIEGVPCNLDIIGYVYGFDMYVYDIPVLIGRNRSTLRCGRVFNWTEMGVDTNDYQIFGVWEGYDEDVSMPGRNVQSLAQLAGQDYRLLYPVLSDLDGDQERYEVSETLTMYRSLDIGEATLPAGTYYLVYEVNDMFGRPYTMEPIQLYWDGQTITYPDDFVWEGRETLNAPAD